MEENLLPIWNTRDLYESPDDPRLEMDWNSLLESADAFEKRFRGRLDDPGRLLEALRSMEKIQSMFSRMAAYAYLEFSVDTESDAFRKLLVRTEDLSADLDERLVFFRLEILDLHDTAFEAVLSDPCLAPYRNWLRQVRKQRPHRLSEKEEVLVTRKDQAGKQAFVRLYDELASSFLFTVKGMEPEQLTGSAVRALFHHPDAGLRAEATRTYYSRYAENGIVFSSVYNALAKDHAIECRLRSFSDSMAPTHMDNQVEAATVDRLLDEVTGAFGIVQDYYKLKALILGVDRCSGADLYAPVGEMTRDIPFDRAREMVIAAYSRFDAEMGGMAERFFAENWLHAPARKGKQGGAYCYGASPDVHPFVLLNYTGTLRDVFTLAHELGHGCHDLLASGQTWLNYHPPLVAAETASVFGEMLLAEEIRKDITLRERLLWFYCSKIEDAIATVFRQAMYIRFEAATHEAIASEVLSSEDLCEVWQAQVARMYGDAVDFLPEQRWTWASIPHFYHHRFYCYAYSFGELFVLCLYRKFKEEGPSFAHCYKDLLKAGGSCTPYELAAAVGENLDDPSFWRKGLDAIRAWVNELQALVGSPIPG